MSTTTAKIAQINLRVPADTVTDLDALAVHDHMSRIDVARQILLEGVSERKRRMALRLYREGKATKSRAAEIAGITLWEMMDLIDEASISDGLTVDEAVEEVRRVVAGAER